MLLRQGWAPCPPSRASGSSQAAERAESGGSSTARSYKIAATRSKHGSDTGAEPQTDERGKSMTWTQGRSGCLPDLSWRGGVGCRPHGRCRRARRHHRHGDERRRPLPHRQSGSEQLHAHLPRQLGGRGPHRRSAHRLADRRRLPARLGAGESGACARNAAPGSSRSPARIGCPAVP